MEFQRNQTITTDKDSFAFACYDSNFDSQERLNSILAANAEIHCEKSLYRSHREEVEASLIKNPVTTKNAFAYFGLMLGTIPPASIFLKIFSWSSEEIGLFILLLFVNLICAVVGYFSGKVIGKIIADLEKHSWTAMLLALPFVGFLWGVITGGAGGVLVFIVGAFFGAIIAAMVGSVAVPAFTVFHRLLKKGDLMERNQFLPIAAGITLMISAFILGI